MDAKTTHDSSWTFQGNEGELGCGPLRARLDVTRPDLGLTGLRLDGHRLAGQLFAIRRYGEQAEPSDWPLPLADVYIRGHDLVATYQPADDWPYSSQVYWSSESVTDLSGVHGSLSLLISVETHLLDTWPRVRIGSQLACREVLRIDPAMGTASAIEREQTFPSASGTCCVLHRVRDVPVSYAEIVPASDFRELTVRRDAHSGFWVEWDLFADFLEKGVIRKARLYGTFLPCENDIGMALECFRAIERHPLPLTT